MRKREIGMKIEFTTFFLRNGKFFTVLIKILNKQVNFPEKG